MMPPADAIGYFFDEHVMAPIASYLHAHGIFVLMAFEAGRANREIPDADQLAFATTNRLVFVSNEGVSPENGYTCPWQATAVGVRVSA